MAYNHFDYVPSTVDVRRSIFKFRQLNARSAYVGYLYPICKPVKMMPGSSITLDLATEIRSGSLVAPLMDELNADFFAFFVPNRIIWEHWKQFLGAVDDVTFNNLGNYTIPTFEFLNVVSAGNEAYAAFVWNQLIACHFGIQYCNSGASEQATLNALPFRGYTFIHNEYFRPEQIVAPLVIGKTDNGYDGANMDSALVSLDATHVLVDPANGANRNITGGSILPVSRAHRDLYSSCLPNPSLETLNLLANLSAPVGLVFASNTTTTQPVASGLAAGTYQSGFNKLNISYGLSDGTQTPTDYVADLNQALLTVNNYRETIMLQNYYDALNRAGSRYDEIIRNIFHVNTSAALIDIPQLIIHKRFKIYRKEVVAESGFEDSNGDVQPLGTQAGYIDTVVKDNFLTCSTVEHGYLHLMYCIRPATTRHTSGIDPDFFEVEKFDQYYPQFDGMGDVPRYKRELWFDYDFVSTGGTNIQPFGYQEYGATWKYQRSDAAGFLDPHVPGFIQGYNLTENWQAAPVLNGYYINSIIDFYAFSNCLVVTDWNLAPHFVLDIRLIGTITHPMPTYNIPGQGALL